MNYILILILTLFLINGQTSYSQNKQETELSVETKIEKLEKSAKEWKEQLSELEYYVIREKGTERSFTGEYWNNKKAGIYTCRACDLELFSSDSKYTSGTGWPSFYQSINQECILEDIDYNLGYARKEIMCKRCEGHLGHVFSDGPEPTGLRYCVNSISLKFTPSKE